ncbi:hypothetical protein PIB30_019295, partial [Stylosanthes scabra]|nr:hypothetical protein [Stylosanthes scabra]
LSSLLTNKNGFHTNPLDDHPSFSHYQPKLRRDDSSSVAVEARGLKLLGISVPTSSMQRGDHHVFHEW